MTRLDQLKGAHARIDKRIRHLEGLLAELRGVEDRLASEITSEEATINRLQTLGIDTKTAAEKVIPSGASFILTAVTEATSIDVSEIVGPSRDRDVAEARMVACWVMRQQGMSYSAIGRTLHRDHTTAMHAVRRVEELPKLTDVGRRVDLILRLQEAAA